MKPKTNPIIVILIIVGVIFAAKQGGFIGAIVETSYQEHANSYNDDAFVYEEGQLSNMTDGDWKTYARYYPHGGDTSILNITYVVPEGVTGAIWETRNSINSQWDNLKHTIPAECFSSDGTIKLAWIGGGSRMWKYCYDTSRHPDDQEYLLYQTPQLIELYFYEEAMHWITESEASKADTNDDGIIDWDEINAAINEWLSGTYTWQEINTMIEVWLYGI